jgi:site-specific recombinase
MAAGARPTTTWDLTALLNAADPKATLPERHIWLVRLLEWLRHPAPSRGVPGLKVEVLRLGSRWLHRERPADPLVATAPDTPVGLLRLRHLLNVLAQNEGPRQQVQAVWWAFWREVDIAALCADFGFPSRMSLASELGHRLSMQWLPGTPDTRDLAALFPLLFVAADADWLQALDDDTRDRLAQLTTPNASEPAAWRPAMLEAITFLVSAVRAAGFSPPLRQRMDAELLADEPFRQLPQATERVHTAVLGGDHEAALREASYLRALLAQCRRAGDSIAEHLEEHGVSVDIVFQMDQLRERCNRIEQLLDCVLATTPAPDLLRLLRALLQTQAERQGIRTLLAQHYSLLARKVAERSAATGEHYITRNAAEYRGMLGRAAGGGAVLALTTFAKFGVLALGLSAFWAGWWAGINYATSFVLIYLLGWTVATKQPAMTAPAMAAKLREMERAPAEDGAAPLDGFIDEVAHLIRSQMAGIIGNLALVFPLVLVVQLAAQRVFGATPIGHHDAEHVLDTLSLLGPTPLYAAFTGVLLFASSLIAGWCENWFVFHRLDSAIAWHPRLVARFGATRTRRWATWWRHHVSGLAANVSLGMMLGVLPVLGTFFGLPIEVRHVTLSTGQLAAALGAEGWNLLRHDAFWWCAAGIAATGLLNLLVSFTLAFRVALRSRGIRLKERGRIYAAFRRRLGAQPLSFVWPPRSDRTSG